MEKGERQSRGMVKHGRTVVWEEAVTDRGLGHCQEKLEVLFLIVKFSFGLEVTRVEGGYRGLVNEWE